MERMGRLKHGKHDGFTLIELAMVMAVLALVAAAAMPRLLGTEDAAKTTASQKAMANLLDTHGAHLNNMANDAVKLPSLLQTAGGTPAFSGWDNKAYAANAGFGFPAGTAVGNLEPGFACDAASTRRLAEWHEKQLGVAMPDYKALGADQGADGGGAPFCQLTYTMNASVSVGGDNPSVVFRRMETTEEEGAFTLAADLSGVCLGHGVKAPTFRDNGSVPTSAKTDLVMHVGEAVSDPANCPG